MVLVYAGSIYFAFYVGDRQLRIRYFAASFAIWTLNGVVLAILLASVGPCFLEPMVGNAHYAEQMAYLGKANQIYPVLSVDVQQQIIAWYASGSHDLGRGISAMPSMHVALAFLFFLAIRQVSRTLGIVFFLFFATILIGSVHLGYHYAVDGYVSILVTSVVWVICGKLFPPAPRSRDVANSLVAAA
ncbi:phosphatase PAP2 family protein [Sphingopyxis sp.]|uniref:phosphatase PAP2 family protein n=1 Tax=Sphingopyxis sp. TaxID=1908224 RepID=UPI003BAAD7EC